MRTVILAAMLAAAAILSWVRPVSDDLGSADLPDISTANNAPCMVILRAVTHEPADWAVGRHEESWCAEVVAMTGPANRLCDRVPAAIRDPAGYLSTAEALALIGVSRATLYRWIQRGLPCHRPGGRGRPRFLAAEIHAFLRTDATSPPSPSILDITG